MNRDNGSTFPVKSKLVEEIQSWSPQIREYYEKFGKKRDLEQYFLSHTYERRPPTELTDSLNLIEQNIFSENRKSPGNTNSDKLISPEIEIREIHEAGSSPSPIISVRSTTPAQDISPEQDSVLNATSPGTLSTSKKLEWDSLGDVGYDNARRQSEARQKELEDREKQSNTTSFKVVKQLNYKVGEPTAHSTPNVQEASQSSLQRSKSPAKSPRRCTGIQKKTGKYNLTYRSNKNSNINMDVKKYNSFNVPGDTPHYEEIETFHFNTQATSPKKVIKKPENLIPSKAETAQPLKKVEKTDREIQTVSHENTNTSVQTLPEEKKNDKLIESASDRTDNLNIDLTKCSSAASLSRAESFEYIPGSMYDKQGKKSVTKSLEFKDSTRSIGSKDILKILEDSNSSQDVGPCLHKISKLLQTHKNNPEVKKKFVKKIVKILLQMNYASDNDAGSGVTTSSSLSNSRSTTSRDLTGESSQKYIPNLDQLNNNALMKTELIKEANSRIGKSNQNGNSSSRIEKTEQNNGSLRKNGEGIIEKLKDSGQKDVINGPKQNKECGEKIELSESGVNSGLGKNEPDECKLKIPLKDTDRFDEDNTNNRKKDFYKLLHSVVDGVYNCDLRDGIQSAPSTLSYSHYLKKKAANTQSQSASNLLETKDAHHSHLPSYRHEDFTEGNSSRNAETVSNIHDKQAELAKINEEILKLTVLKLKLESKRNSDEIRNSGNALVENNNLVDQGGSGDNMDSKKLPEEAVLVYYNTVATSRCNTPEIPPLDLHDNSSSCDSMHENDNNQFNDDKQASSSKSKNKHDIDPPCSCGKGTIRFADSIESVRASNDYPLQESSSGSSGICACCKCKILYSQSSSTESCTAELRRYQKIYDKYQKCVTMRAFVKEYDELIKKYQKLKEKKIAQGSKKPASKCNENISCYCDTKQKKESKYSSTSPERINKTDATTCTTARNKDMCCVATSPLDTPGTSKAHVSTECQITPEISDRVLSQVRKAFAKEYEDITKRLENIKCNCECMIQNQSDRQTITKSGGSTNLPNSTESKCPRNIVSTTAIKSQISSEPCPLSSEEYLMLSQESLESKGKDRVCNKKIGKDLMVENTSDFPTSAITSNVSVKQCKNLVDSNIHRETCKSNCPAPKNRACAKPSRKHYGCMHLLKVKSPSESNISSDEVYMKSDRSKKSSKSREGSVAPPSSPYQQDSKSDKSTNMRKSCKPSGREIDSDYSEKHSTNTSQGPRKSCLSSAKSCDKTSNDMLESDFSTKPCNKTSKPKNNSCPRKYTESEGHQRSYSPDKYSVSGDNAHEKNRELCKCRHCQKIQEQQITIDKDYSKKQSTDTSPEQKNMNCPYKRIDTKERGLSTSPEQCSVTGDNTDGKDSELCKCSHCQNLREIRAKRDLLNRQSNNTPPKKIDITCPYKHMESKERGPSVSPDQSSVTGDNTYRKGEEPCNCPHCQKIREYECKKDLVKSQKKHCSSNCSCRKKIGLKENTKRESESVKFQEEASDDSVIMCLWCKAIPMDSNCRICTACLRNHQHYVENVIQRKKYICKSIPKAVAYNLIVESSESILEETIQNKPKSLEKVFVKVAKVKNKRNEQKELRVQEHYQEDKGSTDEQIRDMSSLNSEQNKYGENDDSYDDDGRDAKKRNDDKTLRDMLEENRPDFVHSANTRQNILKKYNAIRQQRDAEQRKILLKGVHSLTRINQDTLDHLEHIAHEYGLFLPKTSLNNNFKLFNSKDMIKETNRKYKKLPEIENKRLNKKKQDVKKTNLIMAGIFSRKLQRKTLKGVVDISHSRQVVSL